MITGLRKLDASLAKLEEWIVFGILLSLLALAVTQVGWRNIVQPHFQRPPLLWLDEVLKHGTFVLGLLGASVATSADKNITLDIFARLLQKRRRLELAVRLVVRAGTIFVCIVLLRVGVEQVSQWEEALDVVLHPWQWQLAIPLAFGLLTVHFTVRMVCDLAELLRGPPS